MSKRQWLSILGVWVMVFLFLGFPSYSHEVIALITGIIIIAISYNLPAENKNIAQNNSSFVETKPIEEIKNEVKEEII
jgi:hypothetical protein